MNNTGAHRVMSEEMIPSQQYARCIFIWQQIVEKKKELSKGQISFIGCISTKTQKNEADAFLLAFSKLDSLFEQSLKEIQAANFGNAPEYFLQLQNSSDTGTARKFWIQGVEVFPQGKPLARIGRIKSMMEECNNALLMLAESGECRFPENVFWETYDSPDNPRLPVEPIHYKYASWAGFELGGATLADSQEWLLLRQLKSLQSQIDVMGQIIQNRKEVMK